MAAEMVDCIWCDGKGQRREGCFGAETVPCGRCEGTGRLYRSKCNTCKAGWCIRHGRREHCPSCSGRGFHYAPLLESPTVYDPPFPQEKSVSANDVQHGGSHYRRVPGEQHWDRLVRLKGLPKSRAYFVGNATAYAERYEDKNGIEDLKKAAHYLTKLVELEEAHSKGECPGCRAGTCKLADEPQPDGVPVPLRPLPPVVPFTAVDCGERPPSSVTSFGANK